MRFAEHPKSSPYQQGLDKNPANYAPLTLDFEVWPGQTTVADVATLPITSFVSMPGTQFESPPVCNVPGTTPNLKQVSTPVGSAGDSFTIDWIPGTGTVISVRGVPQGEAFREPEFHAALLRIWLGPAPADWRLKEDLLGRAEPAASHLARM